LSINVVGVYGDDALSGSNQVILLLSGLLAMIVGRQMGVEWETLFQAVGKGIANSATAMVILLLIGGLAASWLLGGVCSGHDPLWPGVARSDLFPSGLAHHLCSGFPGHWKFLVHHSDDGHRSDRDREGHGHFPSAMTAGAVISGAYFGDKLSPLSGYDKSRSGHGRLPISSPTSDTCAGRPYRALPLLWSLFVFIGLGAAEQGELQQSAFIQGVLETHFHMTPLVVRRAGRSRPAHRSQGSGHSIHICGHCRWICFVRLCSKPNCCPPSVQQMMRKGCTDWSWIQWRKAFRSIPKARWSYELLNASGMEGMLGTIWLILSAMVFGGAMEGARASSGHQ
jgi:NhaC family Na+:H+ antiporter